MQVTAMASKSAGKENFFAGSFVACAVLFVLGMLLVRSGSPSGIAVMATASTIALVLIVMAIGIVYGFAPDFLAHTEHNVKLEEKFWQARYGGISFDPPLEEAVDKLYLRFRKKDGETFETFCSRAIYDSAITGGEGFVRLLGERLVTWHPYTPGTLPGPKPRA